jgi:hypothetical protein
MYVCCMYVCMYVCMYMYIYIHTYSSQGELVLNLAQWAVSAASLLRPHTLVAEGLMH